MKKISPARVYLALLFLGVTTCTYGANNFAGLQVKAITTRPCLLTNTLDLAELKRRYEALPNHADPGSKKMDSILHAYLYGDIKEKKQVSSDFMSEVRNEMEGDPAMLFHQAGKTLSRCRRFNELLYKYDFVASFGTLSRAEEHEFENDSVQCAKFLVGDDPKKFPSPESPSSNGLEFSQGFSTCNRWPDQFMGAALVGMNFPDQPLAKAWVVYACEQIQFMLQHGNWDGAWNEVPRYHNWTVLLFSTFFEALKNRVDVDFYQDSNTKALLDWYVRFSSPLVRFPELIKGNLSGEPTLPVWGDSNYGNSFEATAFFAPHYVMTDPAFSKRLMWMWRRAGCPLLAGWNFGLASPFLIDPILPDAPQVLGSELCPKMGYVLLRSGFNTADETVVYLRGGQKGITHQRSDLGSIDLFSQGIPLILGSESGPYGPGIEWNRSQQSNNEVVFGGESRDRRESSGKIDAFASCPQADYCVADCSRLPSKSVPPAQSFKWRRHLLLVKNPDYLVVWDEISSPEPSEWFLHTTADHFIWEDHAITAQTAYKAALDIHVLSPSCALVPQEREGIFGIKEKKEDPYPFRSLKYIRIPAQPNESFITILHPRKTEEARLDARLTFQSREKISLKISLKKSTDTIILDTRGAFFQRGEGPPQKFHEYAYP